jgi:hypothetical protein
LNLKCVILYIVCFESKIEKRFVFANRVFVRGPHRRQRLQTRDESRFERSQAPQPKQIKNEASNQHGLSKLQLRNIKNRTQTTSASPPASLNATNYDEG